MNSNLKSLGIRIREARKKNMMSQSELAECIGTSPSYLSDIEMGKKNFGIELFMGITEALQVSADWLLRTDIPQVAAINNMEIAAIIEGCSPQEIDSIVKVLLETKKAIISARETAISDMR